MAKKRMTTKRVQEEAERPFELPKLTVKAEVDDAEWGNDGLTHRQREFVKAYVGPAGGNATRAAEMAGYNANNYDTLRATASENLTKPNVQRAVARALAERDGGKEWTLAGIVEIARTNMADFVTFDANGKASIDLQRAQAGAALGVVKELKIRETDAGTEITVKTYDRLAAFQTLAKMHGTLVERVEHSGPNGGPIETKTSDYDAIETELRSLGGRMAGRATENN